MTRSARTRHRRSDIEWPDRVENEARGLSRGLVHLIQKPFHFRQIDLLSRYQPVQNFSRSGRVQSMALEVRYDLVLIRNTKIT